MLEEGEGQPPYFTPAILATTKRVLKTKSEAGGRFPSLLPKIALCNRQEVDEERQRHTEEQSTTVEIRHLEGKLDAINIHGKPEFNIYDLLTDKAIRCYFGPNLSALAMGGVGALGRCDWHDYLQSPG